MAGEDLGARVAALEEALSRLSAEAAATRSLAEAAIMRGGFVLGEGGKGGDAGEGGAGGGGGGAPGEGAGGYGGVVTTTTVNRWTVRRESAAIALVVDTRQSGAGSALRQGVPPIPGVLPPRSGLTVEVQWFLS